MLKSITTKNFKKLADNHFTFTDGLNIVCGDNAAGKTSLMQALAFALFGVKAVPGNADKIPTWGAKDCKVTVQFGPFTVERTLKNCKVHKDGDLVATGNSTCSEYIEREITGIDLKGFRMLNWSAQGETAALLTLGATQLQRDVEKFSGVEFVDEMIKAAASDQRDLDRDIGLFESKGSEEEISEQIKTAEHALDGLAADIEEEEHDRDRSQTEKERLAGQLEVDEAANRKAEKTEREKAVVESQIAEADKQIENLKKEEAHLKTELAQLDQVVSEGELRERETALTEAVKTNTRMDDAQASIMDLQGRLEGIDEKTLADTYLKAKLESTHRASEAALEQDREAARIAGEHKAEVQRLKADIAAGVCSLCKQSIGDAAAVAQYETELLAAENSLCVAESAAETVSEKAADAEKAYQLASIKHGSEYGNWASTADDWQNTINENAAYLTTVSRTATAEESEAIKQARETVTLFTSLKKQLDRNETQLEGAHSNQKTLLERLSELRAINLPTTSEEYLTATRTKISRLEAGVNESVNLIHGAKIQQVKMEADLRLLKFYLNNEIAFRDKIDESKTLAEFVQYLRDSRVRFLSSMWANILGAASGFLMQATNNRITGLSKSDKDGFMFCEDGVFAPVASASGAQRGFIGVAVRLALAQSLRDSCGLVVLDEPTESMREENALRLSGALLGHGQVVMVTHRESDKVSASNVVEL